MPNDAIYVYCNMSNQGETCVYPDIHIATMPNIHWRKENKKLDWYSNLRGGFKFTYESLGPVQMTFLKLLSQEAYQNFTYTCLNSVAWFNNKTFKYDLAIKLRGENGQEFSYEKIKPFIIEDGCKSRINKSKSIFEIRTRKTNQLPIVDFFPKDYGAPDQAFGFSIGPVCFR